MRDIIIKKQFLTCTLFIIQSVIKKVIKHDY